MNTSDSLPCLPSADRAFGPVVDGCRDNFDFTFAFEQYFFSIAPSVVLLLAAPVRLRYLNGKQPRVGGNKFKFIKLSAIAVFSVLQLTSVVLWAQLSKLGVRDASVAASSISFVTSLMFCALSYVEHSKSLTPSALLNAYLLLSLLFDAVMLRTLWLTPFDIAIRNLFTASFTLRGIILLLEAKEKQRFLSNSDKQRSPEETSGLYSQGLFWWLNSTIRRGFSQILKPDDLHDVDEAMSADILDTRFWAAWNKSTREGKNKLILVTIKVLKWPILLPVIPRLILIAFTFCQPLLVNRFLDYLQAPAAEQNPNTGYGLIGAYALVYFGMAISNGFYAHRAARCVTMLRALLVTAIYTKTTEISITALDDAAAVTLMSTDVERIVRGLRDVHELWANVVQIALATWLLEREIGAACVAPVVVAGVATMATIKLSGFIKLRQKAWVGEIQKRVGITSSILGSMKGIKMMGLTQKLSDHIAGMRVNEMKKAKKFNLLNVYGATLGVVPVMVSPVITFAIFTAVAIKDNTTLDVSRLFTSLSLILLLTQPLFYVFIGIEQLMSSLGCFERIGQFLMAESRADHRLTLGAMSPRTSSVPSTPASTRITHETADGIELSSFFPKQRNLNFAGDVGTSAGSASPAIIVNSGTFGWTKTGDPTLHDINLSIPKSKLTILVGPVASGKSTLLKALLGETPSSKGFVHISSREIAWCEQTPWLINASVQKNIIGFSNFDINLYNSVICACDLEEDISTFPDGDQTLIGSKGITLSGGQRQRVAIARAVYSKKDIAIFDDIFSGLDKKTETRIFERLFGPQGLLCRRATTIIIATHAVNLLPSADQIIALDKGTILEQGTLEELNAAKGYVHSFCLKHANESSKDEVAKDSTAGTAYALEGKKQSNTAAGMPAGKNRQLRDLSVYAYYFQSIGWKYTATFLVLEVCWAFFTTFPTVWLKWWTDANAIEPNQQTGLYLGVYTALQIVGLVSHAGLLWFCFNVMVVKSGIRLHEITLKTVMSASMSFFSATDTGSITTRFSQDIQLIDTQLPLALMCVFSNLFICISQAVLIASATFYIALSFPALIAVFYFLQRYYLRTSRQLRFLDLEEKAPVYTQFIESLAGLSTIRAFAWQAPSIAHNHTLINRSQKPFYLLIMMQRWLTLVLDLITTALAILVVGIAVQLRSSVSVGFTGVALTQIISFTENMKLLIGFWTQLETSIGAVARIKQFSQETEDENVGGMVEPPEDWPSRGLIEFENVSASYSAAPENKVLDSVSLKIQPGERIGIVGRTGSGKSTLILVLLRLLPITSGTIKIDNIDISTIPLSTLRSRLITQTQDAFFLPSSTILENLYPFPSDSSTSAPPSSSLPPPPPFTSTSKTPPHFSPTHRARATEILQQVHLDSLLAPSPPSRTDRNSAHDTPDAALDRPLDTTTLSQGQAQLFTLARTLLRAQPSTPARAPRIVLFDEALSSVDVHTEKRVEELLRREVRGKTVIVIAHREEGVRGCDRVFGVEGGTVRVLEG